MLYAGLKKLKFYIIIFLVITIYYVPIIKNDFIHGDLATFYTPILNFINNEFKSGRLPFWFNFFNFGSPGIFKAELGFFNPFFNLFYLLNFFLNTTNNMAFTHELREYFIIILLVFSSSSFFYFSKKIFKIDNDYILIVASLLYSINNYVFGLATLVHATIFIVIPPLVYYSIQVASEKKRGTNSFVYLIICNYLVFTVGYPSYYLYLAVLQIIIFAYFNYKFLYKFFIIYLFSLGLSMYFLLPFKSIIDNSFRSNFINEFGTFTVKPFQYFEFINPNLGIEKIFKVPSTWEIPIFTYGTFFFVFILLGIIYLIKNSDSKNKWVLISVFFFSLYASGDSFGFLNFVNNYFPLISYIRSHDQATVILNYFIGILVLLGLNELKSLKSEFRISILLTIIFSIFCLIYIFITPELSRRTSQINDWLFVLLQLIICYIVFNFKENFDYKSLLISIFFLLLTNYNINTNGVDGYKNLRVSSYFSSNNIFLQNIKTDPMYRVLFNSTQYAANSSFTGIESFSGSDNVIPRSFVNFSLKNKENFSNLGINYLVTSEMMSNPNLILTKELVNDGNVYNGFESPKKIFIYEVLNPLPKYFSPIEVIPCFENICRSFKDSRKSVNYRGNQYFSNPSSNYKIEIVENYPSRIKLKITSDSKRFIASRENLTTGWSILINNNQSNFYYVDEGFKGFFVESGESLIEISYFPPLLKEGLIISVITLLLLLTLILMRKKFPDLII